MCAQIRAIKVGERCRCTYRSVGFVRQIPHIKSRIKDTVLDHGPCVIALELFWLNMKRYIIQRSVLIDSYLGVHILWRPFALITVIIIVGYSNRDVQPSHDNRVRSFAVHLPTYKDRGRRCVRSFCTRSRPSRRPRRRP